METKQKYIVGIDLGGMSAKAALFDLDGNLIAKSKVKTCKEDGFEGTAKKLADVAKEVAKVGGVSFDEVAAVGIASPGVIKDASINLKWGNYDWINVPLGETVSGFLGKNVFVLNDANAAALGEAKYGAASQYNSSIFVTLGTGVGGGVIIDGKLFEGFMGAGTEIGHIVIRQGGIPCGCGRKGCFERYASATGLMMTTKEKMQEDLSSKMWEIVGGKLENVDGKTAFDGAAAGDKTAQKVLDEYIDALAEGLANLGNVLRPETFVIGGGVAAQGETLFEPLRKALNSKLYVPMETVPLKIVGAKLGNDAGAFGAFAFAKENM
ncbi:MAG: ROK family protein [Clostridia bacterium]|nr:ROK family protein [Clostridia bacterium]